jgi:5,10-methylenetetrahydrofolate reductase
MHISEILTTGRPTLSFEFFPPKTAKAAENLFLTIREPTPPPGPPSSPTGKRNF